MIFRLHSLQSVLEHDFTIKWRMTRDCNLHCSYCAQRHKDTLPADISAQESVLVRTAERISSLIERSGKKSVKLELVGGEVTLFNLEEILSRITSPALKRVQVTSNFMRGADYYAALGDYLSSRGVEFSLTASFHSEGQGLDDYIYKAERVKGHTTWFTCQMVSSVGNQPLVMQFKEMCDAKKLAYHIDADIRSERYMQRKDMRLYTAASRVTGKPRYIATLKDADGNLFEREYQTRNSFITDGTVYENSLFKAIRTKGYVCTVGWDYVYIEFDRVASRTAENADCTQRMVIEDFVPVPPAPCLFGSCTLCGQMSLLPKTKVEV
ncbi:MAG: radical SAM protein [Clostridia bacterium]|nr:radical SAM protein [Clostridia bacterium]